MAVGQSEKELAGMLPEGVADRLSDAVIMVDSKGIIIYMNDFAATLFEIKAANLQAWSSPGFYSRRTG